jgi:hypothetical protein
MNHRSTCVPVELSNRELLVESSSSRPWGSIHAALSGGHGVEDQQVLDLVALVADEQVDQLVPSLGGLQAGRRSVVANDDPGGGGRNQPCGRRRRGGSGPGRLAADPCGPEGEAERQTDRKGQGGGQQEPSRKRPAWRQGGPGRLRRARHSRRCPGRRSRLAARSGEPQAPPALVEPLLPTLLLGHVLLRYLVIRRPGKRGRREGCRRWCRRHSVRRSGPACRPAR